MRNFILSAASLAAIAIAAPASAQSVTQTTPTGTPTQIVLDSRMGTLTGDFGATVLLGSMDSPATFASTFFFDLPSSGLTSASVNTIAVGGLGTASDLDFTSVLLNGVALTRSPTGIFENAFIANLPTVAGRQTLVVNGVARGASSFAGTVQFQQTAAIPEPGTWALMLLGFAAVGFSMRRNKATVGETRVRYNFA